MLCNIYNQYPVLSCSNLVPINMFNRSSVFKPITPRSNPQSFSMFLSDRITLTRGFYQNETRIRVNNVKDPIKKTSFSRQEWLLLVSIVHEIESHVQDLIKETTTPPRTWDLRTGQRGNKRVTAKRFPDSNVIIVDFRIFNFHVNPIKPTKYGISLVHTEWMKFTEVYKEIDNAQHHMKTVISKILRKMITAKAKKDCYGCATDHPSQKSTWTLDVYPPGKRRGKPIWKNVSTTFL